MALTDAPKEDLLVGMLRTALLDGLRIRAEELLEEAITDLNEKLRAEMRERLAAVTLKLSSQMEVQTMGQRVTIQVDASGLTEDGGGS